MVNTQASLKRIVFLTGTRADFGKLKSLMLACEQSSNYELHIFVTGMHMHKIYGMTFQEISKSGFKNIHTFINGVTDLPMDLSLAKTIEGFSYFLKEIEPDLIVIHGDRKETLAGAIVGALNNTLVAHIEGGEISGTIDELIRHAVSKLSHIHFVANDLAKNRLIQLGESSQSIFVIGSPDIDIMLSKTLPSLQTTLKRYEIPFKRYSIVLFHPVTTEYEYMTSYTEVLVAALMKDAHIGGCYVVLLPNDDLGSHAIIEVYKKIKNHPNIKIFPSLRFENFLTLLKHAECIIGNSSAGVREAPVYGVPSIDIGNRQFNRSQEGSIFSVGYDSVQILKSIHQAKASQFKPSYIFGAGNSKKLFKEALESKNLWNISKQKQFVDIPLP